MFYSYIIILYQSSITLAGFAGESPEAKKKKINGINIVLYDLKKESVDLTQEMVALTDHGWLGASPYWV